MAKKRKDSRIESEFYEDYKYTNPDTGVTTTKRVKVTKYKPVGAKKVKVKDFSKEIAMDENEWDYED